MRGSTEHNMYDSRRESSAMMSSDDGGSCDSGEVVGHVRGDLQRAMHATDNTPVWASSADTLSKPVEHSLTATGGSVSPSHTPRKKDKAAGVSGVHVPRLDEARFSDLQSSPALHTQPGIPVEGVVNDVRDTAEYRAAWDLELWKAVQANRFQKELEKQRGVAFEDLQKIVKRRAREARLTLQQRATELSHREEAVQVEEKRLQEHERRLADMERDLRRMRQQLLDAQHRVEDEVRAQVRLANDTIAHRARLLEERVKAAEAQARHADERQRQAQQEYISLYEAFSRYRTQQLTSPSPDGGGITASAGGSVTASSLQMVQLRVQWEAEHQLQLDKQAQRHASDMASVQQRCQELEEQNKRLTAALARRREQLRRHVEDASSTPPPLQDLVLQHQSHHEDRVRLGTVSSKVTAASPSPTAISTVEPPHAPILPPASGATIFHDFVERISHELRRLESERVSLMEGSSGALRETDTVIVRIDARIRELREQLSSVTSAV